MLSYYAGQFKTVEINHSFYRMPTENLLLQWAKSVPEGFKFALKANQQITHIKRLRGCEETLKFVTHRGTRRKRTAFFAATEPPFAWPKPTRKRLRKSLAPISHMCAFGVKTTPRSNLQPGASALMNGFAKGSTSTPTASMKMPAKVRPTRVRC
jgi:uncharacterized protein YecE (DUF72 family)